MPPVSLGFFLLSGEVRDLKRGLMETESRGQR